MPSSDAPAKLFLNYRRDDTAPYAGRLYDRLAAHFGQAQVFMDIDHIAPGEDFVEAIHRKVGVCDIAIVSIGPDWLSLADASGKRRIDDPEDFVRMEIVAALERKIRVIPVLVGGATMPRKQDLPEELAPLSRRNALELSESRFHSDVDRLIEAIERPRTLPERKTDAAVRSSGSSGDLNASQTRSSRRVGVLAAVAIALIAGAVGWFLSTRRGPEPQSSAAVAPNVLPTNSATANSVTTPSAQISIKSESAPAAATQQSELDQGRADEWKTIRELYLPENWLPAIRKNAEAGVAEAQFEMGLFHEWGITTIPQDLRKAAEWYEKAAAQGHVLAQEGLEDLSRTSAPVSELEAIKLDNRRQGRQQAILSHVLRDMDEQAKQAIKDIKPAD